MAQTSGDDVNKKRENYLSWQDYFMGIAFLSAQRSKDPEKQVGACIVNEDNRIVGVGYNGMPDGFQNNDKILSWKKGENLELHETKHGYVCHAELNAITNRFSASLKGCTIYVTLHPCNECAKLIVQSGIKKVVYYSDEKKEKPYTKASKIMFEAAQVKCEQHKSTIRAATTETKTTNLVINEESSNAFQQLDLATAAGSKKNSDL